LNSPFVKGGEERIFLAVAQSLGEEEEGEEEEEEEGGWRRGPRFVRANSILTMGRRRIEGGVTLMLLSAAPAAIRFVEVVVVVMAVVMVVVLLLPIKRMLVRVERVEAEAADKGRRRELNGEKRRRK